MPLRIENTEKSCRSVSAEIADYRKNLYIRYIPHHDGQRTEAIAMAAQDLLSHPAAETAMQFMRKQSLSEESSYVGTALVRENIFLGLIRKESFLGIATINIDRYDDIKEIRQQAYHQAWQALDALDYCHNRQDRGTRESEIIVRKKNALEFALSNLKADIFSAVMCHYHRDFNAVHSITKRRAMNSLQAHSLSMPEYYPFQVVMEATAYAIKHGGLDKTPKKKIISKALMIAQEVALSIDQSDIKQWIAFCEAAQEMAWRQFKPEHIISAAINTSCNTPVRSVGFAVSEICDIKPRLLTDIRDSYSPFADQKFNENLHAKLVSKISQDIIARGLAEKSPIPFVMKANEQNLALTEGHTMGWCAAALQAAAKAFEESRQKGINVEDAVRREFEIENTRTAWTDLKTLGRQVIKEQRKGAIVTLDSLDTLTKNIEGMKALQQSVGRTMKDPHYRSNLIAANGLEVSPALKASAPAAMPARHAGPSTPAHGLKAPGLGGGTVQRTPPPLTEKSDDKETAKT